MDYIDIDSSNTYEKSCKLLEQRVEFLQFKKDSQNSGEYFPITA